MAGEVPRVVGGLACSVYEFARAGYMFCFVGNAQSPYHRLALNFPLENFTGRNVRPQMRVCCTRCIMEVLCHFLCSSDKIVSLFLFQIDLLKWSTGFANCDAANMRINLSKPPRTPGLHFHALSLTKAHFGLCWQCNLIGSWRLCRKILVLDVQEGSRFTYDCFFVLQVGWSWGIMSPKAADMSPGR